eukprot:GGOE01054951.1.p1 GENE.GGOE01054951.1~~GGOE01054951.1.p1  ORF type:complete len:731 (+),score=194.32 GGOE01054951.1:72-2195(+)
MDPAFPERLIKTTVDKFQALHFLVNNAGFTWDAMLHKTSDQQWEAMLTIHQTVPFRLVRAAAPYMRDAGKAEAAASGRAQDRCILNIASVSGTHGSVGQANYSTAKAGILGLTKTICKEWGPSGVRCNIVAFGSIDTRLIRSRGDGQFVVVGGKKVPLGIPGSPSASEPITASAALPSVPLGYVGTPEDAAGPLLLLCSPLASYVSGQCIFFRIGPLLPTVRMDAHRLLQESAQRRAELFVERATRRGLVHTRSQAFHITRVYQQKIYRQLMKQYKKQSRQEERDEEWMMEVIAAESDRRCAAFPQKLQKAFEKQDFWSFEEKMEDPEVPQEIKDAVLRRICRLSLFRLYIGLALPYRPFGAPANRSACFGLPFDVLTHIMLYLPAADFPLYSSVCRDYLRACHTVLADSARGLEAILIEWLEPSNLRLACDCNDLPSLPPMSTLAVPCAVLFAHHAPDQLHMLQLFVSANLPGVQCQLPSDPLLQFLSKVATIPGAVEAQLAVYFKTVMPQPKEVDRTAEAKEEVQPASYCCNHDVLHRWEEAHRTFQAAEAQFLTAREQCQRQRRIDASWATSSKKVAAKPSGQRNSGGGGHGRSAGPDLSRYGPNVRVQALVAAEDVPVVQWDAAKGDKDPARSAAVKEEEANAWRRTEKRFAVTKRQFEVRTAECRDAMAQARCEAPGCRCQTALDCAHSVVVPACSPQDGGN